MFQLQWDAILMQKEAILQPWDMALKPDHMPKQLLVVIALIIHQMAQQRGMQMTVYLLLGMVQMEVVVQML